MSKPKKASELTPEEYKQWRAKQNEYRRNLSPEQRKKLRETHLEWCRKNRDKRNAAHRRWQMKARYKDPFYARHLAWKRLGISQERAKEMIAEQKNVCAICEQIETSKSTNGNTLEVLSLDHCHTTQKVRGFLCSNCNRALGLMKDNPKHLLRAASYLIRAPRHAQQTSIKSRF